MYMCVRECVCVRVCLWEKELCESMNVGLSVYVSVCVWGKRVCVRECVCDGMCMSVWMCIWVCIWECMLWGSMWECGCVCEWVCASLCMHRNYTIHVELRGHPQVPLLTFHHEMGLVCSAYSSLSGPPVSRDSRVSSLLSPQQWCDCRGSPPCLSLHRFGDLNSDPYIFTVDTYPLSHLFHPKRISF